MLSEHRKGPFHSLKSTRRQLENMQGAQANQTKKFDMIVRGPSRKRECECSWGTEIKSNEEREAGSDTTRQLGGEAGRTGEKERPKQSKLVRDGVAFSTKGLFFFFVIDARAWR